ncbi:MAG: hypothetical protein K6B28_06825 [Lachnospiraceae bacterium]|nr:hypothetical protein [Lachnospiraceae bacterium]
MNLRYYLRGLGIGIAVTALLMGFSNSKNASAQMTDAEIMEAASKLGMVKENELLVQNSDKDEPDRESGITVSKLVNDTDDENTDATEGSDQNAEEGLPEGDAGSSTGDDQDNIESMSIDTIKRDEGSSAPAAEESGEVTQEALQTPSSEEVQTENTDPNSDKELNVSGTVSDDGSESIITRTDKAIEEAKEETEKLKQEAERVKEETEKIKDDNEVTKEKTEQIKEETEKIKAEDAAKEETKESLTEEENKTESGSENAKASDASKAVVKITVSDGDDSSDICKKLQNSGIIESASEFDSYLISRKLDSRISSGTFELSKGLSREEIAKILTGR